MVKGNDLCPPKPAGRMSFCVFSDGRGHWCVHNDDETIAGTFTTQEAAYRFARAESRAWPGSRVEYRRETSIQR